MAVVETEALVLRNFDLSDADRIVVFLTEDDGLVRGVAKGAKRLKSKFSGSLEPFSIVNLSYFKKDERELVSIYHVELKQSYFEIAGEIEFLQNFGYLADLLANFAPPHEPNKRLFNMAKACLDAAVKFPDNISNIVLYFELWLLRLGGYLPLWENCKRCKSELNDAEITVLEHDFHLGCENCHRNKSGMKISALQRRVFNLAQKVSPGKFVRETADNIEDIDIVSGLLKRIISQILGKDIVSEKVLATKY